VLPNVFFQLAAFIAAIQNTDLQRSAVPLFERVHIGIDMKSLSPWNNDSRTSVGKLFYERSPQFYVDIVRLYVGIPRRLPAPAERLIKDDQIDRGASLALRQIALRV
jgi:hypothetical protein